MILTIEEAREILRVDGTDNDLIINSLLEAIPNYIEVRTGYKVTGNIEALAKTTAGFILQLWYKPKDKDIEKLERTIDSLLTALTVKVRV